MKYMLLIQGDEEAWNNEPELRRLLDNSSYCRTPHADALERKFAFNGQTTAVY